MSMFGLLDVLARGAEDNLRLIREIEVNRAFILAAYQQNPDLLRRAESRIKALLVPLPADPLESAAGDHEKKLS